MSPEFTLALKDAVLKDRLSFGIRLSWLVHYALNFLVLSIM